MHTFRALMHECRRVIFISSELYGGVRWWFLIALLTNPSYCVLTLFYRSFGATLILNDDK